MNEPTSLETVRARRKQIRNVNVVHHEHLTKLQRFAIWITDHVGSMGFFILLFSWTALWFCWNILGPHQYRFDTVPSFVLWLFISNVLQLFLLPLIMVGQNLQSTHSEIRAEADFEISLKSEQEIEVVLEHLEYQNTLIRQLLKRLETK